MLISHVYFAFLKNPAIADIYTEHAHPVTVAKYAPSGFYIASGGTRYNLTFVAKCTPSSGMPAVLWNESFFNPLDASGRIRIWDTTQKEHMLKYEYTPISGKVKDIAWTEDSKRIAVVGDGREKWVSKFLF